MIKKIIFMMAIILVPCMSYADISSSTPNITYVYTFSSPGKPWIGSDQCIFDDGECYDYDSDSCYYIGHYYGNKLTNKYDCMSLCDEVFGADVIIDDGDNRLRGCGCVMDTTTYWRASGTGRERKYTSVPTSDCRSSTETATNEYRCTSGYYGAGTSSSLSCARCPGGYSASGATVYGTSPTASTSITQCKLAAGNYSDASGKYTLSAPCAYD